MHVSFQYLKLTFIVTIVSYRYFEYIAANFNFKLFISLFKYLTAISYTFAEPTYVDSITSLSYEVKMRELKKLAYWLLRKPVFLSRYFAP